VLFAALPLFHAGARLIVVMTGLYRGIPAQIESAFSAGKFFDRARRTQATVAIGVGAMGAALLASRPGPSDRAHGLRAMMVAPMPPESQVAFRDRFGVEPWTEVFGQTECMPITARPISSDARDRSGCGLPAPDLELALLDNGRPVEDGDVGEICVRSRGERFATFDGYLTDDGAITPVPPDGWHRTGDAARRLPSGAVAFVDRTKDSLRRRGENISSIELEAAINTHPGVSESAVHAVPSDLAEDEIKVCLVPAPEADLQPAELFDFLKQRVPYFAMPRYVEIIDELPRNAVGRVTKHVLRERPLAPDAWDYQALGMVMERGDRR
jgi:crotonobetaine/carnitine-CoA ligase